MPLAPLKRGLSVEIPQLFRFLRTVHSGKRAYSPIRPSKSLPRSLNENHDIPKSHPRFPRNLIDPKPFIRWHENGRKRSVLAPNPHRPRDRFQAGSSNFLAVQVPPVCGLVRANPRRDSVRSGPAFPRAHSLSFLKTVRGPEGATAAAHGKAHYRSPISHSVLRPRERGSPVPSVRHCTLLALPFDCTDRVKDAERRRRRRRRR